MIVYSVSVLVKPGFEHDFIKATKINHKKTRLETENVRFDVLQNDDNPCLFELYEVYRSSEAVEAHKETRHYKNWRETVAPWMDRERKGLKFTPLYPASEDEW